MGGHVYATTKEAIDAFSGWWPRLRIWLFYQSFVSMWRLLTTPGSVICANKTIFSADDEICRRWSVTNWANDSTDVPTTVWLLGGKISDYGAALSTCSEIYLVCVECDLTVARNCANIHIITTVGNIRTYCGLFTDQGVRRDVASATVMAGHTRSSLIAAIVAGTRKRIAGVPGMMEDLQVCYAI